MDVLEQTAMLVLFGDFFSQKERFSSKNAILSISAKNKHGKEIIEISQTVLICQMKYIFKVLVGF